MLKTTIRAMALVMGLAVFSSCGKKQAVEPAADAPAPSEPKPALVEKSANPDKLVIWWAQWDPADGLQKVAADFSKAEGIPVEVKQIPWGEYLTKVQLEFAKDVTDFDIVVGDSQWLGDFSSKGWYLELTDFINGGGVDMNDIVPNVSKYLCKTADGKFWAAPCEPDAMGIVYRADLFKKHGIAEPKTWDDVLAAAQAINKADPSINGWVSPAKGDGDTTTMTYQNFLYAFGGQWGKVENGKYIAKGVINSDAAVEALEFYKKLLATGSPQLKEVGYGGLEKFTNGSTAINMTFFAFFPGIDKVAKEKGWDVKYISIPPKTAGNDPIISLGGQGFSISTKTSSKKQELAKKFITWFNTAETQKKWITYPGCFTCSKAVMNDPMYETMAPYNSAFKASLPHLVDFWNIPAYAELLSASQKHLAEATSGTKTSKQALNAIATAHQETFDATVNK